jgi:hypothetical protein
LDRRHERVQQPEPKPQRSQEPATPTAAPSYNRR